MQNLNKEKVYCKNCIHRVENISGDYKCFSFLSERVENEFNNTYKDVEVSKDRYNFKDNMYGECKYYEPTKKRKIKKYIKEIFNKLK